MTTHKSRPMAKHQRIIDEKYSLDCKIRDLSVFLTGSEQLKSIRKDQIQLLNDQLKVMGQYSNILSARLEEFKEHYRGLNE